MKVDWDRRTCARKGHVTYAPTEGLFAERLHAVTALGDAWRCLRCGDFALGEPLGRQGPGVCPDRPGLGRLIMLAGLGSR